MLVLFYSEMAMIWGLAKHLEGPDYLSQQIRIQGISGVDFTLHKIVILI